MAGVGQQGLADNVILRLIVEFGQGLNIIY